MFPCLGYAVGVVADAGIVPPYGGCVNLFGSRHTTCMSNTTAEDARPVHPVPFTDDEIAEAIGLAIEAMTDMSVAVAECGQSEDELRAASDGLEVEPGTWVGIDGDELWASVVFTAADGEMWQVTVDALACCVERIGMDR